MATEVTVIVDPDGGAGYDYTSLAAAIAGEARDLVTADEQLTITCRCTGGTADGPATVSGFTTDATRYVKIWTDPSESYRHAGTYPSGNKYRIENSGPNAILTVSVANALIEGLAIKNTASSTSGYPSCFYVLAVNGRITFKSCFALGEGTTSSGNMGYNCTSSTGAIVKYINCVATGFYRSGGNYYCGFRENTSATFYYYNCTAQRNRYGWKREQSTVYVSNSVSFNNEDDFFGTINADYCASDDGDGTNAVDISPGATEADDWAACFTDYANGDFSLKSDSVCVGAGVDDPGSGLYSDDILGNTRTSTWDIGAFEYVPFKAAWAINSNRVIQ